MPYLIHTLFTQFDAVKSAFDLLYGTKRNKQQHQLQYIGTRIDNKEFVLDLAVIINNVLFLNVEMQVYHEAFWKERALSYTCRSFDQLNHGEKYGQVLPVVHVGFLNYSLFPEYPEFFANYELANTSSPNYSYLYSDKLRISVVDLTQIELATEGDKNHDIDLWARVFTATTWEEIEMLAQNNEYLKEAVSGVRQLTEDEKIRQQCQAREDFEYWERIRNNHMKELGDNLEQTQSRLEQTQGRLEQTQGRLEQTQGELVQTRDELNQTKDELQQANNIIIQKDTELTKALARIAELEGKN